MSKVISNKVYSTQNFLEKLTSNVYIFQGENDIEEIHNILFEEGIETEDNPIWDYPLDEIDHILEEGLNVVLVECMVANEDGKFESEPRWFEIPEEYVPNFIEGSLA